MKEPDLEHKLLLAEGTLKEIGKILSGTEEPKTKITWMIRALANYHNRKRQIETQGYLSFKIEEES